MSFKQKHPYIFWQLIGWGILLADFLFLVIAALCDFGEWSYPIMVFTFIGALFVIFVSPIIVHFSRKKDIPQNENNRLENLMRGKINAISMARKNSFSVIAVVSAIASVPILGVVTYYLGKYVNLALGFAGIVMMFAVPCIIVGIYFSTVTKRFFTVKNGGKYVDLTRPDDLKTLAASNPRTLVVYGDPDPVLLNFFYNWLRYYLKTERLVLYMIPAPELCRDYLPTSELCYEDILLCIPEEQLDLAGEKHTLFRKECDIMGAFPFLFFAANDAEDEFIEKLPDNETS